MTEEEEFEFRLRLEKEQALSAPEEPKRVPYSTLAESTRSLAKNLTLGGSPHLEALVTPGPTGENLARLRAQEAQYRKDMPLSVTLPTDLTGGIVSSLPFAKWASAGGLGMQSLRGAALGGAQGAGMGFAENDQDRLSGSLVGGAVGTVVGGSAPAVVGGLRGAIPFAKGLVSEKSATEGARIAGQEKLARALEMDGYDAQKIFAELDKYEDSSMLNLLDLVHPQSNTAKLIRGMGIMSRPNRVDVAKELADRPMNAMQELPDELVRRTGIKQNISSEELAKLEASRAMSARNLYDPAYQNQVPIRSQAVGEVMNDPYTKGVLLPRAKNYFAIEKDRNGGVGWDFPEITRQVPTGRMVLDQATMSMVPETVPQTTIVPTTQLLHTLRKVDTKTKAFIDQIGLDANQRDLLATAQSSNFAGKIGSALEDARKVNPAFDKAMSKYKSDLSVEESFELGKKLFTEKDPKELKKTFDAMSPAEQQAFKSAAANEYQVKIGKSPEDRITETVNDLKKPDMRMRLRMLFDSDDEFEKYLRHINKVGLFQKSKNMMEGGSVTAEKLTDITQAGTGLPPSAVGAAIIDRNFNPLMFQLAGRSFKNAARLPAEAVAEDITRQGIQLQGRPGLTGLFKNVQELRERQAQEALTRGRTATMLTGGLRGGLLSNINPREAR